MLDGNWWASACEIAMASAVLNTEIIIFLKHESIFTKCIYRPDNSTQMNTVVILLDQSHFCPLYQVSKPNIEHTYSSQNTNPSPETKNTFIQSSSKKHRNHTEETFSSTFLGGKMPNVTKRKTCDHHTNVKPSKSMRTNENILKTCRKLGIWFMHDENDLHNISKNDKLRAKRQISAKCKKLGIEIENLPDCPPSIQNEIFDKAMTAIRSFELEQMSYKFYVCDTCNERKLNMDLKDNMCKRCRYDKDDVKMFSALNNMDPKPVPEDLSNLTLIEQQLISRISPCMNVHMLKHGGIASSGHCVTFPQEVNEPAQIFPRLPCEISILKVRKEGKNETSKEFRVRREKIQNALFWLKSNNIAYKDIIISQERINDLPLDGTFDKIPTAEFNSKTKHLNDNGPAPEQFNILDLNGETSSCVLLPDPGKDLQKEVQEIVNDITGKNQSVTINKQKVVTIPWPTRDNIPLSEFTTQYFFTMAFPCLFPLGNADYHINRKRTCTSMVDWADHLLWYKDGRFASHQYFKFIVHNMIMRKNAIEKGCFIIRQQLGENHISIQQLKKAIESGDTSLSKKIVSLSGTLRGTSQYWAQRGNELRALTRYKICKGEGLPSFFTTGSCAEFHFKPLKRLLKLYAEGAENKDLDLDNNTVLFDTLQKYTHIVAQYFDLRTQSYFNEVMGPVFGVNTYWYRQEFAKSRGMIHWHGLCWRSDREPHNLLYAALQAGLSSDECAAKLENWAKDNFGMSANHPAGKDCKGQSNKSLWPPPEGTAQTPPEHKNPLLKLLMDVSDSQETLFEDYLLLTNRFNMHRCSDYCLTSKNGNKKNCRMEFGTTENPGKKLRNSPALVRDKNRSLRLEMSRDHPNLVQHSRFHTQGWRANGDISLILSQSDPENPSVDEINSTERYITGYACKGNQPTGAVSDLFNDMINCSNDSLSAKSLCNKLLISTVKRDISAVEASFEISRFPLYRCSHSFQSVSLSGIRVLERGDIHITKRNVLDKYINRDSKDKSSLYQFICKNDKVPVFTGCSLNASWPLNEEYCKFTLLIHWPNWRSLSDVKPDNCTWIEKFESFLSSDICPNFIKADIDRAKSKSFEVATEDQEEVEANYDSQQPDWMGLIKPAHEFNHERTDNDFIFDDGGEDYDWTQTSMAYPGDFGIHFIENLNDHLLSTTEILSIPEVNILNMNTDQRFAFSIVMERIFSYLNKNDTFEPLRLVVTGTAGSGKSFLINCLVKAIRLLFQTNSSVQVICPTGNSANLISGKTIHSFLKIPVSNRRKDMSAPEGALGEQLQKNCEGLHVLLVDERSLIGATTLGWMEFHTRYGMNKGQNSSLSWGGLPVIVFFGDDIQLPPVLDSPVYDCKLQTSAALHSVLVWQEFSSAVTLHKSVRQNEKEVQLKEVLTSVRNYMVTPSQAEWLQKFQWNAVKLKYGSKIATNISNHGLHVFPTHNEVWNHNKSKILQINKQFPIAKITATFKGAHAISVTREHCNGLPHTIFLCKSAKVMLTCNLCVSYGLFNGATGVVVDIIFSTNKKQSNLPKVVMVEFECYTGPPFIDANPKIVPIMPIERVMDCQCHSCKRIQIPLNLGWATTIHKCQGMTVGKNQPYRYIVINPGPRAFESRNPGALFVALSRAKSAGDQHIEPDFAWHPSVLVNEDRLCHKVVTSRVKARNQEVDRIRTMSQNTSNTYSRLNQSNFFHFIMSKLSLSEE